MTEPYVAYQAPTPGPRRRWVIPVVIVSILVVVALVAAALFAIVSFVQGAFGYSAPDQPLVSGEPGSAEAVDPLICPPACFTEESIEGTIALDARLDQLGVPDTNYPFGTYDPVEDGQVFNRDRIGWETNNGSPDACFFVFANSPVAASLESGDEESTDLIYFTGTHEDTELLNSLDQAVRVFADTESATEYLTELADNIDACGVVGIGSDAERYSAEVTRAPGLSVPDSVAAVGWVRTGDPGPRWRAYTMDVQLGNLVVRNRLLTDGSIHEQDFRDFVEAYSEQLADLELPAVPAP